MDKHLKLTPVALGILSALYGGFATAQEPSKVEEVQEQEVITVTDSAITLDRTELEESPKDNPTLSQVLKHHPRVGIDDAQKSMQGGDLTPEEISLAGARPHQTKYTIDGVGVNNSTTFSGDSDTSGSLASGHTSGYFVDTNLLDGVEVLDHNISAEHGGFTGGVVNAELRKPTEKFTIDYNYRMSDSDWNAAQKVGQNFQNHYGNPMDGSGKYQPNYQKRMHALHMGGAISENQKLAINVSHQVSEIPLALSKDVDQRMDNIFVTHVWESGLWQTTTDFRYADHQSNNFSNDARNDKAPQGKSETVNSHSGIGGTFKVERLLSQGRWETSLSYDHLKDQREADTNYLKTVTAAEGNYAEGTNGNLQQEQDAVQLKSTLRLDPIIFGDISHQINMGVNASYQTARVYRPEEFVAYNYNGYKNYLSVINYYAAANYSANSQEYGLFIDDQIHWDRLTLNLGGRVDHLSVFEQTVFSPRLSASWDFDWTKTNRVTLGASRYYSANLLGWALKAEQGKFHKSANKCTPTDGNWDNLDPNNLTCQKTTQYSAYKLNHADIPYADELTAAWAVDVNNFAVETVYLYRMQRDGLTYSTDAKTNTATVHNNVESDNHLVSLDITTIDPYHFLGGALSANWNVAYDHRRGNGDIDRNFGKSDHLGSGYQDEWVVMDGQLMRVTEMDTSGYQSPVKSSLNLIMHWNDMGLVWNNRINYQQGKKASAWTGQTDVIIDGESESVESLMTKELTDLVTWDMSMHWTPNQFKNHVVFGMSVTNLLNRQEVISMSGMQLGRNIPDEHYNAGRQIWLNVNLRN
ncbi:hypothetical protein VST7929_01063 [Vibrio stylophorae]|uniref:TonB-dependent receptor plug domain-containing protein n=1 Tax=Vibrio stylophorae TaxID=659351 RepID=A0ABN8DT96_9VIBR|nr:TonB-dependent receptor plug domain-containing protein [Vibrio stylophorae]CAH0533201.1 hypothetical protein VST7929_01063 [Vibrio stylophorae]